MVINPGESIRFPLKLTALGHGLNVGDAIEITNSQYHNGMYRVDVVRSVPGWARFLLRVLPKSTRTLLMRWRYGDLGVWISRIDV